MTIEERLAQVEQELARVKRRTRRWLTVGLLGIALLATGLVVMKMTTLLSDSDLGIPQKNPPLLSDADLGIGATPPQSPPQNATPHATAGPDKEFTFEEASGKTTPTGTKHGDWKEYAIPVAEDTTPVAVVRASAFVLVDANGRTRGSLEMTPNGPLFRLCDENGKSRAGLYATKDGPGLVLCDENGKSRAMLYAFKDGPGLVLCDENGKARAMLDAFKDGPGLVLCDENGKAIWSAP